MRLIILILLLLFCATRDLWAWDIAEAAKPYRGQVIKISLMAGYEVNKVLSTKIIPQFEEKTGVRVETNFVSYQDVIPYHQRILDTKDSEFDLINVDNVWFPFYVNYLQSIDGFMRDRKLAMPQFNTSDFIPELLLGFQWKGHTYCFPATFEFPILMVREDLLKKAGLIDKSGNVLVPKNLDEYYEYAKLLTQDVDGDGKIDIYGTTLHGYKTGIFDEIVSWYWGAGGELLDNSLRPSFDNPLMSKVLNVYQKIFVNGYASPESVNWELGEASTAFRTGKAAMSWNWTMVAAWILDPQLSYVAEQTKFVPLFKENSERVHYLREASYAMCIPKNAKNKEAAFLFIQWLTSSKMQKEYIRGEYRIHPSRKSVIFSQEYADKIPYARIQRDTINKHAIRLCPKILEYPAVDQTTAMYFQQVVTGALSVEEGIKKASEAISSMLEKDGYYDKHKTYPPLLSGRYK